MGSEWTKVSIESIQANEKGAIAIGPFGSRLKSDNYVESGVPVIRGTNVTGGPTFEGDFVYITEEKADTLGSCNVYKNELVFPHRGSIGEVGIIKEDNRYVLSSSLMKLKVDEEQVDPLFIYYFFKSATGKHELLKNASQVGTPGIGQPLTSLKKIEFHKPSLFQQKKIANILASIDEKIALNRQINQTLEQMAQTLFKSWFVDYDPVIDNALDAGSSIPEVFEARVERRKAVRESADFKPLPDHVRKLFPSEFEESELGWVPKGWRSVDLTKMVDSISVTYPLKEVDKVIFLNTGDIDNGKFLVNEYSDSKGLPGQAKKSIQENDILF
ncbi:restriction endonuclease subunit S, partial [Vibrio rotiferianus]